MVFACGSHLVTKYSRLNNCSRILLLTLQYIPLRPIGCNVSDGETKFMEVALCPARDPPRCILKEKCPLVTKFTQCLWQFLGLPNIKVIKEGAFWVYFLVSVTWLTWTLCSFERQMECLQHRVFFCSKCSHQWFRNANSTVWPIYPPVHEQCYQGQGCTSKGFIVEYDDIFILTVCCTEYTAKQLSTPTRWPATFAGYCGCNTEWKRSPSNRNSRFWRGFTTATSCGSLG